MNLFFWNLNKNDNIALIADVLRELNIDVAAFAEHDGSDLALLCNGNIPYRAVDPIVGSQKVRFLVRDGLEVFGVFYQGRYALITVASDGSKINIAAVHLQDCRNDPKGASRSITIRSLVADLRAQEREQSCKDSVIIGDFNVQPFSAEMYWAGMLNAASFKNVVKRMLVKRVDGCDLPLMYNPTLEFLSEADGNCGSYYCASGSDTFYWYCLDQAIVSPSLADAVAEYRYLRTIGNSSLMADCAPKSAISDHLPLFVRLDRSELRG